MTDVKRLNKRTASAALAALAFLLLAPASARAQWTTTGNDISNTNTGNVGVGTGASAPGAKLDVRGSVAIDGAVPATHISTYPSLWMKSNVSLIPESASGYSVVTLGTNYQRTAAAWTNVTTGLPSWSLSMGAGPGYDMFELNHSPSGAYTRSTFMVVNSAGNVGVGTRTPLQRLQVGGNNPAPTTTPDAISLGATYSIEARANPKLRLWDNGDPAHVYGLGVSEGQFDFMTPSATHYVWSVGGVEKMRLDESGNVTVAGSISATYQDVAEWVPSAQKLAAGTVVVLDKNKANHVLASTKAYDTKVAGVVSAEPGVILGVGGEGKLKVATTGRVRVKVDATRSPIEVGDLLVTGEVEGVAMKSVEVDLGGVKIHRPGTIIGKALEPLAGGTGEILVLLSLQ
jgi:cytoskeletal protein CcmA (bactofilin family)